MIGAVVFVIVFVLFLLFSLVGISLPVGNWIFQEYVQNIIGTGYEGLAEGIMNGIIYGVIVWFIFTISKTLYNRTQEPEEMVVKVEKVAPVKEVISPSAGIEEIKGIGSAYSKKLRDEGITTTGNLLEAGSTKRGRNELAEKTGIAESLILEWVNEADLSRIQGIGIEYSALLEEAGVNTVVELARRNPENLHATIVGINDAKELVIRAPSLSRVKDWIEQAKSLPRKVEY